MSKDRKTVDKITGLPPHLMGRPTALPQAATTTDAYTKLGLSPTAIPSRRARRKQQAAKRRGKSGGRGEPPWSSSS